jgi:hypothetical protein
MIKPTTSKARAVDGSTGRKRESSIQLPDPCTGHHPLIVKSASAANICCIIAEGIQNWLLFLTRDTNDPTSADSESAGFKFQGNISHSHTFFEIPMLRTRT